MATNLVTNGDFTTDTSGWVVGGSNTIVRSTAKAHVGAASALCTYVDDAVLASYAITLPAGSVPYTVTAWVYIPATYNGDGLQFGFENFGGASGVATKAILLDGTDIPRDRFIPLSIVGFSPAVDVAGNLVLRNTGGAPSTPPADAVQIYLANVVCLQDNVLAELVESGVRQVQEYIQQHYADHVDAVNVHFQAMGRDTITITAPPSDVSVIRSEAAVAPELPAVLVIAEQSGLQQDSPVSDITRHNITVVVTDTDSEQDTLRTMMYRHTLAMFNCLKTGQQQSAFGLFFREPYASYSPIYVERENPVLFMDMHLNIAVQTEEVWR